MVHLVSETIKSLNMPVPRVFVTGGSGFIGTNLVQSLVDGGLEVLNFDHKPPLNRCHGKYHQSGEILDSEALELAIRSFQPEFVVHLAARCDLDGASLADYAANTIGVRNIISAINNVGSIKRVVFASSRYVHPTATQPQRDDEYAPFTYYGASKAEGEKIVRTSNVKIPWVIIRPTSIWGPWFGTPYRGFFDALRRGLYVHPRGERLYKTYGYVGNVVHQIKQFLEVPLELVHGRVFYVADYEPVEVMEMAKLIRESFEAPKVREVPLAVLRALASAGDGAQILGWKNPPMTSFRLTNLRTQMVYDMSATREIAGPCPYTVTEGVRTTVSWIKKHGRN
jgi:nucleoside-diphosphate-sugar epimerase